MFSADPTYKSFQLAHRTQMRPGTAFHYADTNYLLLALLVENWSGLRFHEAVRTKILGPLGLENTYLEFYESPRGELPFSPPYYGQLSLELVNSSFDWGGGGLVSTMDELCIFAQALFSGQVFQQSSTLKAMQDFKTSVEGAAYGLGIELFELKGAYWMGHRSAYGGALFYQAEQQIIIISSLNQIMAPHKAEFLLRKAIAQVYSS